MKVKLIINNEEEQDRLYSDYIKEHVANVRKACNLYSDLILESLSIMELKDELLNRVNNHDKSKWSEEEFKPYAQYFYPIEGEEPNIEIFNKAWQHHYKNNDHHPEHYHQDNKESIAMTDIAIAEMLLDWIAMTFKFKTPMKKWYRDNKEELNFNSETLMKVDSIMNNDWIDKVTYN